MPEPARDEDSWMLRMAVLAGPWRHRASVSLPAPLLPTQPWEPLGWSWGRGFQPTANSVRDVARGSSPTTGTPVATGSGKPVPEPLCPCCHHCPRHEGQEPGCAPSLPLLPHVRLGTDLGRPSQASPPQDPPKALLPEHAPTQNPNTETFITWPMRLNYLPLEE